MSVAYPIDNHSLTAQSLAEGPPDHAIVLDQQNAHGPLLNQSRTSTREAVVRHRRMTPSLDRWSSSRLYFFFVRSMACWKKASASASLSRLHSATPFFFSSSTCALSAFDSLAEAIASLSWLSMSSQGTTFSAKAGTDETIPAPARA